MINSIEETVQPRVENQLSRFNRLGYIDVEIYPSLDLFEEIDRLKK